jgi:hypothetical protein
MNVTITTSYATPRNQKPLYVVLPFLFAAPVLLKR